VRSRRPQSRDDIRETVDYIFETRLQSGQLDDSGLTLNDLRVLRDAFLTALQGIFHPRIAYPGSPGQGTPSLPKERVSQLPAGEPKSEPSPAASETASEASQDESVPESIPPAPEAVDMGAKRFHPPGRSPDQPGAKDRE
jgi:hypothetical protein